MFAAKVESELVFFLASPQMQYTSVVPNDFKQFWATPSAAISSCNFSESSTVVLKLGQRLSEQFCTQTFLYFFFLAALGLFRNTFTFYWIAHVHYVFWTATDILILNRKKPHIGNEPVLCLGSWKRMWKYLVLWYFSSDSTDTVPQALWK